jgi:hypothetical protein
MKPFTGERLDNILTMAQRPQLLDAPDVRDVRSMNPQETFGIQRGFDGVQRYVKQTSARARVEPDIVL